MNHQASLGDAYVGSYIRPDLADFFKPLIQIQYANGVVFQCPLNREEEILRASQRLFLDQPKTV